MSHKYGTPQNSQHVNIKNINTRTYVYVGGKISSQSFVYTLSENERICIANDHCQEHLNYVEDNQSTRP